MDPARRLVTQLTDLSVGVGAFLISGEAGMGKTHLLHHLARSVRAAGGQVGWCQCNQALGGPPLWEWRSAIAEVDAELPAGFPGTDGLEVFQATWQWLESTATHRPTLLVLDDLHDASPATIDLFEQLSRRPRSAPWIVVAATRTTAASTTAARDAMERLAQMRVARSVLGGLDAAQVLDLAELIDVELTSSRAEELVRFTGGNPLFVRRILETGAEGFEVTPELLSFIAASIGDLDATVRPVAEALSVLGVASARSTLQLMVPADHWPTSLASDHTLLVEGLDVTFRHPLLREVIYDSLEDERRSELHARAAHVIEQLGGSSSLAAVHWSRASLAGQGPAAADTALRAGHLALDMGMWADAVTHFSHAGAVLQQLDDLDHRAASGAHRARALSMSGDIAAALRAILDSIPSGDEVARVSLPSRQLLARELARLRWREEPNPSTLDPATLLRAATALLGDESDPVSLAMLTAATVVAGEIGGLDSSHASAARDAMQALPDDVDPTVRGEAALALRRALMADPSSLPERIEASQEAAAAAAASGDVELTGRSLRMLLTDAMGAGDRPLALSTIAAFDTAATTALREHQALGQAGLAVAEGRYVDANDTLDAAAKELSYVGRDTPSLDFARSIVALDQGGFGDIIAQYEPILAVVADASLRSAFGYVAATEGNVERATELIDGTLELLDNGEADPLRPVSLAMIADAALIVGSPQRAHILELLEPLRGTCVTPANAAIPWLGSADRLIGLLEASLGNLETAEHALRSSLAVHRGMQADPWVARSLVGLAAVQRALGQTSDALVSAAEAEAIVERLDMAPIHLPDVGSADADADADAAAAGATVRDRPAVQHISLDRSDRGWVLRAAGDTAHVLANLVGLGQLALLLGQPGREWHVLDLVAAAGGAAPSASHAGDILDNEARRSYQNRMATLRDDLNETEQRSDLEHSSRILLEIDAIESELLAAFGLGGKGRRMGDEAERSRVNVRRNLNRAILAIEDVDPVVGDHLRHRVITGRFCSYRPLVADPITWAVSSPLGQ